MSFILDVEIFGSLRPTASLLQVRLFPWSPLLGDEVEEHHAVRSCRMQHVADAVGAVLNRLELPGVSLEMPLLAAVRVSSLVLPLLESGVRSFAVLRI